MNNAIVLDTDIVAIQKVHEMVVRLIRLESTPIERKFYDELLTKLDLLRLQVETEVVKPER